MITIALDESGVPEEFLKDNDQEANIEKSDDDSNNDLFYIAGIIYDDKGDEYDAEDEKYRLDAYFHKVSQTVGCKYPEDLHYNKKRKNSKNVKKMKAEIRETIAEFLSEAKYRGKFVFDDDEKERLEAIGRARAERNGKEYKGLNVKKRREGYYRIVAMLDNKKGKSIFNSKDTSTLLKDDHVSNRYLNMAYSLVSRLAFHNPIVINIDEVTFDLATRTIKIEKNKIDLIQEYTQLGHIRYESKNEDPIEDNDEFDRFQIIDEHAYRTMISQKLLELDRTDLKVNRLSVRSIYYGTDKKGKKDETNFVNSTYLYLSDIICSLLRPSEIIKENDNLPITFCNSAKIINRNAENLIFVYDDIDDIFEKAMKAYQEKNYYKALSFIFKGKNSSNIFAKYYKDLWFRKLENLIAKVSDEEGIEEAIHKVSRYAKSDHLNQEELVYLYDSLEPLVEQLKDDNPVKYKFYDKGISAYNHIGNSKKALDYFEKCKSYSKYYPVEDFLDTLNRKVVILNDQYEYDKALEEAKKIVEWQELLTDVRNGVFKTRKVAAISEGRALSQRGQVYAYQCDVNRKAHAKDAELDFQAALDRFDENSADKYRTRSYLLHHYINVGEQDKYEMEAKEYFSGRVDIKDQFDYLKDMLKVEKNKQNFKFAFYVFIKALYTFYVSGVKSSDRREILNYGKTLMNTNKDKCGSNQEKELSGHPWELIYKYYALLAYKWNQDEDAATYIHKMQTTLNETADAIDNAITRGLIDYYTLILNENRVDAEERRKVETALEEAKGRFKNEKVKKDFEELLVYMHK